MLLRQASGWAQRVAGELKAPWSPQLLLSGESGHTPAPAAPKNPRRWPPLDLVLTATGGSLTWGHQSVSDQWPLAHMS